MILKNSYDKMMSPFEKWKLRSLRALLASKVTGDVIEIGVGTGVSLPYYNLDNLTSLALVDEFTSKNVLNFDYKNVPTTYIQTGASKLPFHADTFDFACVFLTICSMKEPYRALSELRRVLRPHGRIVFLEHVRPQGPLGLIFDFLNVFWRTITRGCNINRNTVKIFEVSGFKVISIKKFWGFFVYGVVEKI